MSIRKNHSGAEDYGLPYSMDFALDERSDGIYVYTLSWLDT